MGINLDPSVAKLAQFIGLFDINSGKINNNWLKNPLDELRDAFKNNHEVLLELLGEILQTTDGQLQGIPGPNPGDVWYPIPELDPQVLFITTRTYQAGGQQHLVLGVGVNWKHQQEGLSANVWAKIPLADINTASGQVELAFGEENSPVQLAFNINHQEGFGDEALRFDGIKLSSQIYLNQDPELSLSVQQLSIAGATAKNVDIANLIDADDINYNQWFDLIFSLLTAKLRGDSVEINPILDHLFPILGLSGSGPLIHWFEVPSLGLDVIKQWALQLIQNNNNLSDWLTHWYKLLNSSGSATIEGTGTRVDPKRVALPLSGNLQLWITFAYTQNDQGHTKLYPGLVIGTPNADFGTSDIKLNLESRLELCCIPLNGPGNFDPLPTFDVCSRLYRSSAPGNTLNLADVNLGNAGGDFDFLGQFSVKEMRAGLTLDDAGKIAPKLELVDVRSSQGNWPTLDLTAGQTFIEGLEDIANSVISEQLNNLLGAATESHHAGKHIAALLGIIPPTSHTTPSPWSPSLVISTDRLSTFLGNPLAAIACYHAQCIETQDDNAPLWRFLLEDLQTLLKHSTVLNPAITGLGSPESPWKINLYKGDEGDAYLSIYAENDITTSRPQLDASLLIEPNKIALSNDADLQCQLTANVMHLDLPQHSQCPGTTHARWLDSVAIDTQLLGKPTLTASTGLGLTFSADSVSLGCIWLQGSEPGSRNINNDFSWAVDVENFNAIWNLETNQSVSLPNLRFGAGLDLKWNLSTLSADLGIDLDDFSLLIRLCLGSWLVERGGSFGFGLAALFGLFPNNDFQWPELPDFPGISLPSWNNSDSDFPFRFPVDWPTFDVADWGAFFTDPWPDLVAYFKQLFSKPEWSLTAFNFLGGMLFGKFPDLSLPDWGWGNEDGDGISLPSLDELPFTVCGGGTYENPWVLKLDIPDSPAIDLLCWLDPDGPPTGDWGRVVMSMLPTEWQDFDELIADAAFNNHQIGALLNQLYDLTPHIAQLIDSISVNSDMHSEISDFLGHALNTLESRINLSDGLVPFSSQLAPSELDNWSQAFTPDALPEACHSEQLNSDAVLTAINHQINTLSNDNALANDLPILLLGAAWESEAEWSPLLMRFPGIQSTHINLREVGVDPDQINVSHAGSASTRAYIGDIAVYNTAPSLSPAQRNIPINLEDPTALSQAQQIARIVERIHATHNKPVIIVAHSHSGLAAIAAAQRENSLPSADKKVAGLITVGTPLVSTALVSAPLIWTPERDVIDDELGTLPADFNIQQGIEEAMAFLARAGLETLGLPAHLDNAIRFLHRAISRGLGLADVVENAFPTHAFEVSSDLTISVPSLSIGTQLPRLNLANTIIEWLKLNIADLSSPAEDYIAPTHIGFGVRTATVSTHTPFIVKQQSRADLLRVALTETTDDADQYVKLPRISAKIQILKENGWVVGNIKSNPRVRWAELSIVIDSEGTQPNAILHDAYLDGVELLQTELQQVFIDSPGDTFDLQTALQRLLDAVIQEVSDPALNLESVTCVLNLLAHIDLVTQNGDQYGFNLDGWQALLNDAENYLHSKLAIIVSSTARRNALLNTLADCFECNLRDFPFGLLGSTPRITIPNLEPLQALLAAFELLLPNTGDDPYGFNFPAWIDLFTQPQAYLQSILEDVFTDPAAMNQLMLAINTKLGLNAVSLPQVSLDLSSLCSASFSHDGLYQLCYLLPKTALGGQITLKVCITVDLLKQQISGQFHVAPTAFDAGLTFNAVCELDEALNLTISHNLALSLGGQRPDSLPFGFDDLQIYPAQPDFSSKLGELLPRFLLNTTLSTLIERFVFEKPALGGNAALSELFVSLGLGHRLNADSPIRLRPLDGLILSPKDWLLSQTVLGSAIDGEYIDSHKVCLLFNHLVDAFELADEFGVIQLPYGLSLTCTDGAGVRFTLASTTPIALSSNDTLALRLNLNIGHQCQVGVAGDMALRYTLPDPIDGVDVWDTLGVDIGFNNASDDSGTFNASVLIDSLQLNLLPFTDWTSLVDLSGSGVKLLNTALDALLTELERDADLTAFITQMRGLLVSLDLDSPAKIDTFLNNPLAWLNTRLSLPNINAALTAINNLLSIPLAGNIAVNGNLLVLTEGDFVLKIGRNATKLGAWLELNATELGPISLDLGLGLETNNLNARPALSLALDLSCTHPLIDLGAISIAPSLSFNLNGGSTFQIYPLGNIFADNQCRLDLLPTLNFAYNNDCILTLLNEVVLPLALEVLLDTDKVTQFLSADLPLIPGISLGNILTDCQLLLNDGDGFNLNVPYSDLNPEQFLYRLLWSTLKNLSSLALIDDAVGVGIVQKNHSPSGHTHYGVHIRLPDARLVEDPEFKLLLGSESTEWLNRTGGPTREQGGIYFYLPTIDETGTVDLTSIDFKPEIELINIGVELTGKNDQPLIDTNGFRLDGAQARLYFRLTFDSGVDSQLGATASITQIGLPIGGAGGNVVGQNLLSSDAGSGGESSPVNPAFSVELSYYNDLDVRLMGRNAGETEIWFPIQKTFGPIHIGQVGIKWYNAEKALELLLDGGVSLAGLNVFVDDLGVKIPIGSADDLSTWKLGLKGLGISYVGGGVKISGALLRDNPEGTRYSGAVLVEVSGKTFTAIGSYAKDEFTSMFVFVLLPITIGGPPYLFITGLAGGFGYNRGLTVPSVDDVPEFPLIEAARGSSQFSNDPLSALNQLGDAVPIKRGSYWIAGGIRFSSFELAKSTALAYILLDRGLEVGILGLTQMELPEGNPLVNLELALKARFSTRDGVLSVEARLSDNSWLLDRDCRLTGGFAFYVWFDGQYQGDFVITVGGYHHRFIKPSHYPDVPRLGFNWRVSSKVTIKGESYFALTPSAVMAGGLLEASYKSGNLKAWFKAWAHFLIAWKPFAYAIGFGINIGVSYRLRVNLLFGTITKTFNVELGAEVEVWGPKFSGIATIKWWVIDFDVRFGANVDKVKKDAISWTLFRQEFLPENANDILSSHVISGTLVDEKADDDTGQVSPWVLEPEFIFGTSTVLGTNHINLFDLASEEDDDGNTPYSIDIRPMHKVNLRSTHHVRIKAKGGRSVITEFDSVNNGRWRFKTNTGGFIDAYLKAEQAPAALWEFDDGEEKPNAKTIDSYTGVDIVASVNENHPAISKTGEIPVKDIIERGIHPLPFHQEIADRSGVLGFSESAELTIPNQNHPRSVFVAASQLLGPDWSGRRDRLLDQLDALGVNVNKEDTQRNSPETLSRLHVSPPKIVSLYEGLAKAATPQADVRVVEVLEVPPVEYSALRPSLTAILKQRAEPLREVKKIQRTRVKEITLERSLPRVNVGKNLSQKILGASLKRATSTTAGMQTLGIRERSEYVLSGHSSSALRQQFKSIEKNSISSARKATPKQRNIVISGATQVWDLPTHNTRGNMPIVVFSGNQGFRITALNRGGALLHEKEFSPGEHQWRPPLNTARIAMTGLGKPSTQHALNIDIPRMGAIAFSESSNGLEAVGWQHHSQLIQLSKLTLLARGAVISLNAPLALRRKGKVVRQAIVSASDMTRSNDTIETLLPNNVDLVCIQVQNPVDSRLKNGVNNQMTRNIIEALAITSPELILSDQPLTISSAESTFLVYEVEGMDYGPHKSARAFSRIGTTTAEGWQVTGVIGLKGETHQWMKRLSESSLTPIVENGPLSPAGQTDVQFIVDDKGDQS